MPGCKKVVEPEHYFTPDAIQTAEFSMVDSKSMLALSDVEAKLTYPDGSSESIQVSNGALTVDVKYREDGVLNVLMEKAGFISKTCAITIDRSDVVDGSDWSYPITVLMTEANDPVSVTVGVEKEVDVEGSDASVKFPADCLNADAEISITEMPAAAEQAEVNNEVEVSEGRVALKSFSFLPEGQVFEVPIEVTFEIPEGSSELVFATLVDGEWESVPVSNNGDGTGTALVSHFCKYHLSTKDVWKYQRSTLSEPIFFHGECDEKLEAIISQSFNYSTTQAKNNFMHSIKTFFSKKKKVKARLGYYRTVSGQYTIKHLKNVTKGYKVDIPSKPVIWAPEGQQTCHGGGSGS